MRKTNRPCKQDLRSKTRGMHLSGASMRALIAAIVMFSLVAAGGCSLVPWLRPGKQQSPSGQTKVDSPAGDGISLPASWGLLLDGSVSTPNPEWAVSPDGSYLLTTHRDASGYKVIAVPLKVQPSGAASGKSEPPRSGQGEPTVYSAEEITLFSISTQWVQDHLVQYFPIGWASPTQCSFAVFGWHEQGPHKGSRGLSVITFDVANRTSYEAAFIDLPQGLVRTVRYVPSAGRTLIHVTGAIWEYDMSQKKMRLVRSNLPVYDGLFHPVMSPAGDAFIYELVEQDRRGLYFLDVASGEEKPFLPAGETYNFYPSWSPDGRYVAVYTAPRKGSAHGPSGTPGTGPGTSSDQSGLDSQYDIIPGEDGPVNIAPVITVLDRNGNVIKKIQIGSAKLTQFVWSRDSKSLYFLSGTVPQDTESPAGFPRFDYESIWACEVAPGREPLKVADLAQVRQSLSGQVTGNIDVYIVAPESLDSGAYFALTSRENSASSLWYASPRKKPEKIADGLWQLRRSEPWIQGWTAGLVSRDAEELWLLAPGKSNQLASYRQGTSASIAGYSSDILVVSLEEYPAGSSGYQPQQVRSTLVAYKLPAR